MDTSELAWDDIRIFLSVAETGSVSAAARRLMLGQPTVSRRLAELEARVGVSLFERGRFGTTLTGAGERMLGPARQMAEHAAEVARAAAAADQALTGVVRVTAPPLICATLVAHAASKLERLHPQVRIEALAAVRTLDLQRGEADLAIRTGPPRHADLISVQRIEQAQRVYVSRDLAERLGPNVTLLELPWIAWAEPFTELVPNPQLRRMIPDFRPVFTTDDFIVMVSAAERGVGAVVLADAVHRLMHGSRLVPLALDLGPYSRGESHLLATKSALGIPRVRAVADLIAEQLRVAADGAER